MGGLQSWEGGHRVTLTKNETGKKRLGSIRRGESVTGNEKTVRGMEVRPPALCDRLCWKSRGGYGGGEREKNARDNARGAGGGGKSAKFNRGGKRGGETDYGGMTLGKRQGMGGERGGKGGKGKCRKLRPIGHGD